jgi:hypothetical protein
MYVMHCIIYLNYEISYFEYIKPTLGCMGQRSIDTRKLTNLKGTRNNLLATCTMIGVRFCLGYMALKELEQVTIRKHTQDRTS